MNNRRIPPYYPQYFRNSDAIAMNAWQVQQDMQPLKQHGFVTAKRGAFCTTDCCATTSSLLLSTLTISNTEVPARRSVGGEQDVQQQMGSLWREHASQRMLRTKVSVDGSVCAPLIVRGLEAAPQCSSPELLT